MNTADPTALRDTLQERDARYAALVEQHSLGVFRLLHGMVGDRAMGRRVWLELGDGAIEELACRGGLAPGAYPGWPSDATFAVTHAFAAGTLFPQLTMERADGSTVVQTAAQVIVGPSRGAVIEAPRSSAWLGGSVGCAMDVGE